jgi:hypothetical protein
LLVDEAAISMAEELPPMKDTPLTLNASAAEGRSDLFSFFFLGGFAAASAGGGAGAGAGSGSGAVSASSLSEPSLPLP